MRRVMAFGERSAAREFLALVPVEPAVQGLLLRHGFQPLVPVYLFQLPLDRAVPFGDVLIRLLPGQNVTQELLSRRGLADLDRIDRLTRNITREVDHVYWLKDRQFNAAVVRQGSRIAAYAYGGMDQAGPVAGSSPEAALSAMGWAIILALKANHRSAIILRVPAPFVAAIDALQEAGAQLCGTEILYGQSLSLAFDRCLLGAANLP